MKKLMFLLFLLTSQSYAARKVQALTPAQTYEHVGRMLEHGVINFLDGDESKLHSLHLTEIARWAKDYRINGVFGTLADRTEAMKTFQRRFFLEMTGKNAVSDIEYYKKHWLEQYATGESGALEP